MSIINVAYRIMILIARGQIQKKLASDQEITFDWLEQKKEYRTCH